MAAAVAALCTTAVGIVLPAGLQEAALVAVLVISFILETRSRAVAATA
jgi:uncharacterized membrane protein YhiD involved in acid resistance